jgi:PalH/RIM21
MEERAIWDIMDSPTSSSSSTRTYCTPFTLPSGGVITLDTFSIVTLNADAVFQPQCTSTAEVTLTEVSSSSDLRDPFYASTLPQCYALSATTVIAYMLVIMLFITPRTFLSGGIVVLGRRGFTAGPSGTDAGIGIGGRPWLQKVAAVGVAISLTIATANTFRVAQRQYETGYMDALALQNEVMNSMELKIIRVISDTFLWLAQAQTLIRLFPRQREKVIIKWTAFALITLNLLFSILNTFVYSSHNVSRPYNIVEAIPAISYLFHLALGLLYGAWVIYYGVTKRTYAFYHPNMRNICLVALISITAVFVPVVFFVLDISKPDVAGWGDYVRWVGAAAASVVVWEWVERIEALERNDKKDGVLGREIFDGDEMLEVTPSSDFELPRRFQRNGGNGGNRGGAGSSTGAATATWPGSNRHRIRAVESNDQSDTLMDRNYHSRFQGQSANHPLPPWPAPPLPTATPISRTDTGSAESTLYAIRYHPIGDSRLPIHETAPPRPILPTDSFDIEAQPEIQSNDTMDSEKDLVAENLVSNQASLWRTQPNVFQRLNPFRRTVQGPPAEVSRHTKKAEKISRNNNISTNKWDVVCRLEDFAAIQAEKFREKARPTHDPATLPVTRIPAPARRRTLGEIIEELDNSVQSQDSNRTSGHVGEETLASSNPVQSSNPSSSARLQAPQASGVLESRTVTSRGNVSFADPIQRDRDRRADETIDGLDNVQLHSTLQTPQSSQYQSRGSSQPRSPDLSRLPVMRIPAPPRRTRSDG